MRQHSYYVIALYILSEANSAVNRETRLLLPPESQQLEPIFQYLLTITVTMAREIIDLTRSPSAVDRKPDVRLLQQYDRKPDIRTIPKTPLGPTKRVPATTGKKGKAVATAGKTPIERRENHVTVKKELILDNIDDAL